MTAPAANVPADQQDFTTLSVIVCAYTDARWDLLVAGIDALSAQLDAEDELIVVIDYNEALLAAIETRYGQVAQVRRNIYTRGLSGAVSRAFSSSSPARAF